MIQTKLFVIELKEYFRSPAAAFWTFAYPFVILALLMFAFGDSTVANGTNAKIEYGAFLLCGMVTINTMSTSLFGFAIPLVEARQRGALKMFQVFPVWRFSYVMALVASRVTINMLFNAAFLAVGSVIFNINLAMTPLTWLNFLLLLLVCSATFVALGLLLVSVCNRAATATAVANVVFFPMLFFSDLFIPSSVFPPFLQGIATYSPVGIAGAAFRDVVLNHMAIGSQALAMTVLLLMFAISIGISSATFRWRNT